MFYRRHVRHIRQLTPVVLRISIQSVVQLVQVHKTSLDLGTIEYCRSEPNYTENKDTADNHYRGSQYRRKSSHRILFSCTIDIMPRSPGRLPK